MPSGELENERGLAAVNRRELSESSRGKTSKWPRTSRRQQRIAEVLNRRQPDLTVVLENVHDPHNVSSVLRSCDAVGVLRVHLVYSIEEAPKGPFARTTSASAAKWIEAIRHGSIDDCYRALRQEGFTIVATALVPGAVELHEVDLRTPSALVFGNEMRGLSDEAVAQADRCVAIPMMGMVQSLNISVACAVTLYEALRQRREAGDYARAKLPAAERERLIEDWLKR
ncbi:MAG TPA: RNA methyltransferase [Thermomicrobiales bacterium]|jgi:tRNA (guanosine-2'-O-)-methyltransferase